MFLLGTDGVWRQANGAKNGTPKGNSYSPSSELLSPSIPCCLWSTFFGNARLIASQRTWFTSLLFRFALRAQVDIRNLHIGQVRLASCTFCLKQFMHSSCRHGIVTGSIKMYKHIGHIQSDNLMIDVPPPFSFGKESASFESDAILVELKFVFYARFCASPWPQPTDHQHRYGNKPVDHSKKNDRLFHALPTLTSIGSLVL